MNKPKLDLLLDKPIKLTLLKDKPYIGNNNYGEFYLFNVKDDQGVEYSYFADNSIYQLIQEHKLKAGSSFVLQRVATMNGKKMGSKVEFSIIGEPEATATAPISPAADNLKSILLTCLKDAADAVREAGLQFNSQEVERIAVAIFIQRSRNA